MLSDSVRPFVNRAPSWSWASIDGGISPYGGRLRTDDGLVEILDASAEAWNNGSLRSPAVKGSIRLSGPLKPFKVKKRDGLHIDDFEVEVYTITNSSEEPFEDFPASNTALDCF
jgi:hypothetical protein